MRKVLEMFGNLAVSLLVVAVVMFGVALIVIYLLPRYLIIERPLVQRLALLPSKWRKYSEIKKIFGGHKKSARILCSYAQNSSCIVARLRKPSELERIARFTGYPIPKVDCPLFDHSVIFYEFLYRHDGGRRVRNKQGFLRHA